MSVAAHQTLDDSLRQEMRHLAWEGVDLCRIGRLEEGFASLELVAAESNDLSDVPAAFFAFLGLGTAMVRGRYRQAEAHCLEAIDRAPNEHDGYLCLARVHSYFSGRGRALAAIHDGLESAESSAELLAFRRELGMRRPPVVPFLSRDHGINQLLGRLRHRLLGPRAQ